MARPRRTRGTVLVTPHDLPLAGELRKGFRHAGHVVEFFTAGEDPADSANAVLLVLTGGARDEAEVRQAGLADALGMPVFAVLAPDDDEPPPPAVSTTFTAPADPEEIVLMGTRAVQRRKLRRATGIVGETDAMMEVLERVVQIAPVDATVLITGESGTGKELVARGIHALSRRRHRTFIPVNMAALTETLLESELFGHEKGSFTGAIDTRKGLFELANRGTIFLDEIGEMAPHTQTRLLRIIEQQEFHRVGGQKLIQVDVRIVAATNRRLDQLVLSGDFRRDLYHRLNVLKIALPPLRDRPDDIPLLVDAFVHEAAERHDRGPFRGISQQAMDILLRHRWPGNVRELRNLVESMVVLAPGRQIRAEDIPREVRSGGRSGALVPAMHPQPSQGGEAARALRPQIEFIFRSMMEMKVDIEDLKREFEAYQSEEGEGARMLVAPRPTGEIVQAPTPDAAPTPTTPDAPGPAPTPDAATTPEPPASPDPAPISTPPDAPTPDAPLPGAHIAYRPGMTLDDVEREVIRTVLDSVDWNRRLAAEELGIGERTLYRKVKRYGLEEDRSG